MNTNNCTDTILNDSSLRNDSLSWGANLSWGEWMVEGRRLVASDARKFASILILWQQRARARHAMAEMDERILKDIGLSARDMADEASKPFWKP